MSQRALVFMPLLCFMSCKDNPYQAPHEASQQEPAVYFNAVAERGTPSDAYSFSGTVELGTPISGATIAVHKFSELKIGDKIAEAVSNRDGLRY